MSATVQLAPAPPSAGTPGRRRARSATSLTRASGLGLGIALLWFSLLVLIPLTAVVVQASSGGWSAYVGALTSEQTLAALRLTVGEALLVTAVNVVIGTMIAWVLVRDQFPASGSSRSSSTSRSRCRPSWPAWCCSACTVRPARSA